VSPLEHALLGARALPWPGPWPLLQALAAACAAVCFWLRTRGEVELRRAFLLALPVAVIGALALGSALRGMDDRHGWLGVSSYGALLGMVVGFLLLTRRQPQPAIERLRLLAPSLLLLVAVGRLGCFAAGCEPGRVTDAVLGVKFPRGSATYRAHLAEGWVLPSDGWSLAVHPVQLYEAALALCLFALVLGSERRAPRSELLVAGALLGYLALRVALAPWHA
jgi:prolipoprotein diacylglyceryltransferase